LHSTMILAIVADVLCMLSLMRRDTPPEVTGIFRVDVLSWGIAILMATHNVASVIWIDDAEESVICCAAVIWISLCSRSNSDDDDVAAGEEETLLCPTSQMRRSLTLQ